MTSAAVLLPLLSVLLLQPPASVAETTGPGLQTFASFIQSYGRTYQTGTHEYETRRALFEERMAQVQSHNMNPDRRWTAGVNHLTDWSEAELKQLRGWRGAARSASVAPDSLLQIDLSKLPKSKSWASLNASQQFHDQGPCGSCWALATTSVMQAHSEIYRPTSHRRFAAQELVNCVKNPDHCGGTGGCQGATVELAMDYIMHNGLSMPHDVRYTGSDGKCIVHKSVEYPVLLQVGSKTLQKHKTVMEIHGHNHKLHGHDDKHQKNHKGHSHGEEIGAVGLRMGSSYGSAAQTFGLYGWERLPENQYEPLLRAVAERGPVAVSASADSWQSYQSGVFDGCKRDSVVDHAVTLIGYGKDHNDKYWLIKNSWGKGWGMHGTIKLLRRDDDDTEKHCGIDHKPEEGTICKGGPSQVKVCGMCGILYDSVVPHFQPE